MATLTGQRIKDTYDAVLKLEDNAALTSSPKAITDGLGNNTPISVSTIKVDVSSDLEASSFVKTSGLSTQFLKADGSVDSSAYLTSGDLPASHWSSNLVGIDYTGGNVGIGTTSPSEKLEVNGNVDVNGGVYVSGVNSFVWNNTANSNLRFGANGSEKMRITSAGNVGIGTTSPSAKLQIDSTSGWGVFTERGIKDGSTSTYSHNYGAGNAHILGRAMYFENSAVFSTSTADSTTKEYRFSNASDKLTVKSLVSGVTVDNNILVLSGSNVGIGTASPLNKLQVSDGSVGIDSQYMIRDNRNNTILHQSANTAASNRSLTIGNATYSNVIIPNGNVGIGTTSPSEKLHVEGDIRLLDELIFGEYSTTTDRLTNQSYALTMAHSTALNFKVGTASVFNVYGTQIRPQINNTVDLGHSGFRWKRGYFAGNLIANSIGIGTDYPSDELTIEAESPTIRLKDISSSNYAEFYVNNFDTYLDSAGRTFIQSGGSTNVTVTSAGNVGIGTTAPSTPLHINADAPTIRLQDATSGDNHYLTGNNGELRVQSSGYITMRPGATVSTTFLANGNVGIGTTSPDYPLHVDATIKIGDRQGTDGSLILQSQQGPNITFKSTGDVLDISGTTGATNGNSIRLSDNIKKLYFNGGIGGTIAINRGNRGLMDSNVGGLEVQQQDTAGSNGKSTFLSTSSLGTILRSTSYGSIGTSGDIQFQFGGGANTSEPSPTTKMIIKNSGNVGIGTTSPSRTLSVKSSSSSMVADFRSASGNNSFVSFSNNASTADQVRLGSTSGNLVLSTNYTERIRIDASGNVGIGTTSPLSRLHVVSREINNGANKGIRIENYNGTKDYSIRTGVSGIENTSLAFYDETAGANRIVITSAGNVGIGTDSPSEKLEVDGQVLSDGYRLAAMQTAPATRNSTGTLGEIVIDGNYIYVCYAASSWSRVALETSW